MELDGIYWGPSNGTELAKIVFLHGMGGTGKLWRPIAAGLEDQFAIFAPDQRGHGLSRAPAAAGSNDPSHYTPLQYGLDLAETLQKNRFHPSWIVGHSMGVRSACAFAHLRPDWVRGLILIDLGFAGPAGGGLGEDLGRLLQKLPPLFPTRLEARSFMAQECPDPAIAQYLMAVSETDPKSGEVRFPFDREALIQTIQAARDSSVREWVRELGGQGLPMLILRGANSLVWTHDQFEEEKAIFSDLPLLRFVEMSGTGHGLPFEKRTEFLSLLKTFVGTGE